jgi:RNA polymerase sigma-70 factor (ECF subfamily)
MPFYLRKPSGVKWHERLSEASAAGPSGRYQIEAAIQSAHVARRLGGAATWPAIVALYDHLLALTGSPVVALNRAVALAETDGPGAALAALDPLAADELGGVR